MIDRHRLPSFVRVLCGSDLGAGSPTVFTSTGAPFANTYCWVCRFDGDLIVEVRAYLDSAMVAYTIDRNESRSG